MHQGFSQKHYHDAKKATQKGRSYQIIIEKKQLQQMREYLTN